MIALNYKFFFFVYVFLPINASFISSLAYVFLHVYVKKNYRFHSTDDLVWFGSNEWKIVLLIKFKKLKKHIQFKKSLFKLYKLISCNSWKILKNVLKTDRDRRRRNSSENYRDLNPMLTTNTRHIASTQAINSTSSILGEAPSKPINILPQIPPITTPFSVPPPTLNPYINPLLHTSYLGIPPTIDTSVPPPNMIPPPNFLFPQTINPTISQLLPQINTDG